ncbi:hypothetical protein [Chryseobacterium potabilaquae]|uniref:Uncharacterized protein n=1 Tax=Chryseobacterium potabilaquae TaxID=2675057 RepID=A0A6N4X971_9FLAO|nr:hypothetical protein [Chryseobacterium potabilaquae]CAA7196238.1 hypothetical protein CHRY9293_02352 [Chryseobacterium potabilaquae]
MYSISKKINITKPAFILQNIFRNDEIGSPTVIKFTCCDCNHENTIEITPYQSGFPILQIYKKDTVLSKNELLKNRMVSETSQGMLHFGEVTVNNLPTLYFGTTCSYCYSKYIGVFGYGETQPGLTSLVISGIWKYEESI